MRWISKTLMLAFLLIVTACTAHDIETHRYPAEGFPFRHSDFDFKVAWKVTKLNNVVKIDGILKNTRYAFIDNLDVTIYLMGLDGKIRARTASIPTQQQSHRNDVIPFSASLKNISLHQEDTLLFLIHYLGDDGGHDTVDWHSSFAVDAITGATRHKENVKPEEW